MLKVRSRAIWIVLLFFAFLFSSLYLWFTLFPGAVSPQALSYFKAEQIQGGRAYSFVPRLTYIFGFLFQVGFLIWFIRSRRAELLSSTCQRYTRGREWFGIFIFFLVTWIALNLISLPLNYLNGFYWQHHWGFSTQTLGSWILDYIKESGLDLLMSGVGVLLLFLAFRIWPRIWWIMCALFFSLWLIIQSVLWPILIAPLFNHFEPVQNIEVTSMVHELAEKAGVSIDQILVMDASQRTTKANAYFAGLGETKRIVLYDNLLKHYSLDEVKAVIAHEMAHWQKGHIVKGILLGILGSFIIWGGAYHVIRSGIKGNKYPPMVWAVFLLFVILATFVSSPVQNYISRQMEIEADQTSVLLTGDANAAIRLQMNLSQRNRSDLSPPSFIEWFSYTHPSVLTRIERIEDQE